MIRCAIYARVSLDEQHGQDLDRQIFPLRKKINELEYEPATEFIERESGADMLRPQFRKMLKAFRDKEFEVLMVLSLDRLARFKPQESMFLLDRLSTQGMRIISLNESWFELSMLNESTINLHAYITFWKSWDEHNKAKKRSKSGIESKKDKGEYRGGRPKGKRDSTPRERRWKVKPDIKVEDLVL